MRKRFAHNRAITLSLFFASDKFDETSFFVCVLFYFVVGVCVCVCVLFKNKDSVKEETLK